MGDVATSSDKLRLAFKLFDSEGVAVVNTLNLGRVGIQEMRREAQALGATIGTDAAKNVSELADAMTNLGTAITGIGNELQSTWQNP